MILSNCPDSLAHELSEQAVWLAIVYDNNLLGMQAPWTAVVAASENLSIGAVTLPAMEIYKIRLPQMLCEGGSCQQFDLLLHQFGPINFTRVT
jgi:hypothetical protein